MKRNAAIFALLNLIPLLTCYETGAEGGGAAAGGGTAQPPAAQPPAQPPAAQPGALEQLTATGGLGLPQGAITGFQNLLARHGNNALQAAAALYDENHTLRAGRRELTLAELTEKVKATGGRVLTKEEGESLDRFLKLGKIEEVETRLTREQELTAAEATRQYLAQVEEAANLTGYKPRALQRLVKAEGLKVVTEETGETAQDGTTKLKRSYVVTADAAGKEVKTPLSSYLETNFKDDLVDLRADGSSSHSGASTGGESAGGGDWLKQPGAQGGGGNGNPAASYIASTYAPPATK